MYINKMSRIIISNQSNLNSLISRSKFLPQKRSSFSSYCSHDARQFLKEWRHKITAFRKKICAIENVVSPPKSVKEQTETLLHLWTRQCECVVAQRVRRGQQMFTLYSKLWEERSLRAMLYRFRQQMLKHGRHMLLSATGIAVFNWDKNRISDDDLLEHTADIDDIHKLTSETVKCKKSDDNENNDTEYTEPCKDSAENWVPYLDRTDILVWRREESPGKYAYKMYASYDDVTAFDFLQVQIDINYRKIWDSSVMQLQILDSDPRSNSDLVYWESKWPRFFANRDYVFNRRYYVDQKKKIIVIINRSTAYSGVPNKATTVRVKEYWSHMVIRANNDFNKPGIEFSLTYFDDPGIQMPDVLTNWVSASGMPDFVAKMRVASIGYQNYLHKNNLKPPKIATEKSSDDEISESKTTDEDKNSEKKSDTKESKNGEPPAQNVTPDVDVEVYTADAEILYSFLNSPMNEHDDLPKYWRYLQPLYFFY